MIMLANLLAALALLIDFMLGAYFWIVVGSAVVSWVNADPWNPIVKFLRQATSPLYARLRRWFPFLSAGAVDFAPMLVLAAIFFLRQFVVASMVDYSVLMKARFLIH